MSEILEALEDEITEFHMTNDERVTLIEMLAFFAGVLETGKIWINKKDRCYQQPYIELLKSLAKRFANMRVEQEQ